MVWYGRLSFMDRLLIYGPGGNMFNFTIFSAINLNLIADHALIYLMDRGMNKG